MMSNIVASGLQYGRIGYEAYAEYTGGKTFDGRDMPEWDDLTERTMGAWIYATLAVAREVEKHHDVSVD